MKNHTDTIVSNISKIVSRKFCKELARKTGFVQRSSSRLNGYEFVKTMIIGNGDDSLLTYKQRLSNFNSKGKLSIPGLAQRINKQSAEQLMFEVLAKCLTSLYERTNSNLKNISRILIQDSTCLPLNQKLGTIYSGSGGHHKNSGIKIDCIYDYTNETILDVQHYPRTTSDAKNGDTVFNHLKTNDLILRDLGYFKIDIFKKIIDSGAFFVSRLKQNVAVYLRFEDKEPVTFIEFLKKKLKNKTCLDCTAYIGQNKEKVRLIVNKVPDDIVNQKLRRANRDAQVRRETLSDSKKAFLSYTILVTNLPEEIASTSEILMLYRIRWRIELVFKEWKSQVNIGNITGTNIHRIRCLIYARLCLLLIINKLTSYISNEFLRIYKREVCKKRVLEFFLEKRNLLKIFIYKSITKMLNKILNEDPNDYKIGKRKKRKTTLETLLNSDLVA